MAVWSSILRAARQKLLQNGGSGTALIKNGDYPRTVVRDCSTRVSSVFYFTDVLLRKPTVFRYAMTAQCIWMEYDSSLCLVRQNKPRHVRIKIKMSCYETLKILNCSSLISIIFFFSHFF